MKSSRLNIQERFDFFAVKNLKTDKENGKSQNPGNRIRGIQETQIHIHPEEGVHPDQPHAADADQRDDHRDQRMPQTAKRSDHDVHDSAEEIRRAENGHANDSDLNDFRVGGVNL